MANGLPATIGDARDEIESLRNAKARARQMAEDRMDRQNTAMYFAGTRLVSSIVDTMFPQFATIKPIAEIGGGLWLLLRAMDPREANPGAMLGASLALLIGPIDRISSFFKDTVAKFAKK